MFVGVLLLYIKNHVTSSYTTGQF